MAAASREPVGWVRIPFLDTGSRAPPECPSYPSLVFPQYSEKEDKYEEEIKLLSDKLKEVRVPSASRSGGSLACGDTGELPSHLSPLLSG